MKLSDLTTTGFADQLSEYTRRETSVSDIESAISELQTEIALESLTAEETVLVLSIHISIGQFVEELNDIGQYPSEQYLNRFFSETDTDGVTADIDDYIGFSEL